MTRGEVQRLRDHWTASARQDWRTYLVLRREKRYVHSLFFLHLTVEKWIKAIIVAETGRHAPFGHNLPYLLGKTTIEASEQQLESLATITRFNSEARYPDQQRDLYRTVTKEYAHQWDKEARKLLRWLKNEYAKL